MLDFFSKSQNYSILKLKRALEVTESNSTVSSTYFLLFCSPIGFIPYSNNTNFFLIPKRTSTQKERHNSKCSISYISDKSKGNPLWMERDPECPQTALQPTVDDTHIPAFDLNSQISKSKFTIVKYRIQL